MTNCRRSALASTHKNFVGPLNADRSELAMFGKDDFGANISRKQAYVVLGAVRAFEVGRVA